MKKIISVLLCVLCMSAIFYLSHESGKVSLEKSYKIINIIKNNIDSSTSEKVKGKNDKANEGKNIKDAIFLIRKSAHFIEFLILAVFTANVIFIFGFKGSKAFIYIIFLCLFYAVLDEYHQLLVGSRTSSVEDVLIDFSGAILGTLLYYGFYYKVYCKLKFLQKIRY